MPLDADRLAVEAARRDPLRFETLYRKYVAQVYSFALYETRAHHAAEDVTEQVFLQALRGLPTFDDRGLDEGSTFRAWLFQICRNVLANERRRDRRHPQAPSSWPSMCRPPTTRPRPWWPVTRPLVPGGSSTPAR